MFLTHCRRTRVSQHTHPLPHSPQGDSKKKVQRLWPLSDKFCLTRRAWCVKMVPTPGELLPIRPQGVNLQLLLTMKSDKQPTGGEWRSPHAKILCVRAKGAKLQCEDKLRLQLFRVIGKKTPKKLNTGQRRSFFQSDFMLTWAQLHYTSQRVIMGFMTE